jgi:hypothetical protein
MKTLFLLAVGACAMYLYLNPGDTDGLISTAKSGVNKAAQVVVDATEPSPAENLQKKVDEMLK